MPVISFLYFEELKVEIALNDRAVGTSTEYLNMGHLEASTVVYGIVEFLKRECSFGDRKLISFLLNVFRGHHSRLRFLENDPRVYIRNFLGLLPQQGTRVQNLYTFFHDRRSSWTRKVLDETDYHIWIFEVGLPLNHQSTHQWENIGWKYLNRFVEKF